MTATAFALVAVCSFVCAALGVQIGAAMARDHFIDKVLPDFFRSIFPSEVSRDED